MGNHVAVDGYSVNPPIRVKNAVRRIKKELGNFPLNVRFMGREGEEIKKFFGSYEVHCEELSKEGVAHHVLNYIWRKYRSTCEEVIYLFLKEAYEKGDILGISIVLNQDGTVTIDNKRVGSIQKAARQKIHIISWEEKDFAENQLITFMLEDIIQGINNSSCPFYLEKLREVYERLKRKIDPTKVEARMFIEGSLGLIEKRKNWPAALFKLWAAIDRLEKRKIIIEKKIIPKAERERRAVLYYLSKSAEADYLALKAIELNDCDTLKQARSAFLKMEDGYGKKVSAMISRILELREYQDEQIIDVIRDDARATVSAHLELLLKG